MSSTITTLQGDTWDILAYRAYGNEHLMNILLAANPDLVDVAVFSAGTQVFIPDVEDIAEKSAPPPWRE